MPNANGELVSRIDMALHIQDLCIEHSIAVVFIDEINYQAQRNPRKIKIRPTRNTGYYVSALHEIGHIVGDFQTEADTLNKQEFHAWRWAKENALTWTDTAERVMIQALQSYGIEEVPGGILVEA